MGFSGSHNHKYFLGFLASLFGLCIVVLSASVQYWQFECWTNLTNGHTADNYLVSAATCDPWVMWIAANTALHSLWVGALLACQAYQVRFWLFRAKLVTIFQITVTLFFLIFIQRSWYWVWQRTSAWTLVVTNTSNKVIHFIAEPYKISQIFATSVSAVSKLSRARIGSTATISSKVSRSYLFSQRKTIFNMSRIYRSYYIEKCV